MAIRGLTAKPTKKLGKRLIEDPLMSVPETTREREMKLGRRPIGSRTGHKPHDGKHNASGRDAGMTPPKRMGPGHSKRAEPPSH